VNPAIEQILLTIVVLLIAVLLPLLPTVIIYKLFPAEQVVVSGPFKGLTVQAAGAFAAYLITFVGATPFAWVTMQQARTDMTLTWTVRGHLVPRDANGNAIQDIDDALKGIQVGMSPSNYQFTGGEFWVKVPESEDHRIPALTLSVPGFENTTVNYSDQTLTVNGEATNSKIARDEALHEVSVKDGITMQVDLPSHSYSPHEASLTPITTPPASVRAPNQN
jgi:HSP20 family molecular chaperone IbpA